MSLTAVRLDRTPTCPDNGLDVRGSEEAGEEAHARARTNLKDGEPIGELVQVETGSRRRRTERGRHLRVRESELGIFHRSKVNAGPHVLVATDRNLYAMGLSGGRLLDVGEVVIKAPLDQAGLYRGRSA